MVRHNKATLEEVFLQLCRLDNTADANEDLEGDHLTRAAPVKKLQEVSINYNVDESAPLLASRSASPWAGPSSTSPLKRFQLPSFYNVMTLFWKNMTRLK
jgi:hypothetical protein